MIALVPLFFSLFFFSINFFLSFIFAPLGVLFPLYLLVEEEEEEEIPLLELIEGSVAT